MLVSKFINLDPRVCGRASLVILLFLQGDLRTRMTTLDEFLYPTEQTISFRSAIKQILRIACYDD